MPQLDDDEDIRARRRALAERELALREAEIEAVSMRCDGSLVTFRNGRRHPIVLLGMDVVGFVQNGTLIG